MSAVSSSSSGHAEPMWILISSAVRSPMASENSFLTYCRIASSSSSPATRTDCAVTMPPSEMTATSVVPPPMSTIMLPLGSCTGMSAPIAAAIGSSMMCTGLRAPAYSAASCTARCSTPVMPDGTQMTMRGLLQRLAWTFWMKKRSIFSQTSKSAMTPSFSGRIVLIRPGVRPIIRLASRPTATGRPSVMSMRDDRGFVEHDAVATGVDQGVRRAEIDGQIPARAQADCSAPSSHLLGAVNAAPRPGRARRKNGCSTDRGGAWRESSPGGFVTDSGRRCRSRARPMPANRCRGRGSR